MKTKTLVPHTEYKEVEIEFPFYAYWQEENGDEIHVKIDQNYHRQIKIGGGSVELSEFKYRGTIARIWIDNKSNIESYNEALNHAKVFVNEF